MTSHIEEPPLRDKLTLTVPEAALKIGRTASAVESLRLRWRKGIRHCHCH